MDLTVPDLTAWGVNLAATLMAALVVVLVALAFGVAGGKHRIIDVFWGLGFAAVALTVVWGVRLAAHIGWRGRGEPEDPRYVQFLRPGQPGPGAGHRSVAVHPSSELLRRCLRVVGFVAAAGRQLARCDNCYLPDRDDYLLLKKTGKPLLEAHLSASRPGYAEYVRRTSGFVPLPPRRGGRPEAA
jgi:steroid 5-alpha reductase family enzyme